MSKPSKASNIGPQEPPRKVSSEHRLPYSAIDGAAEALLEAERRVVAMAIESAG